MIIGARKSLTENGTVTSSVTPYFLHRRVTQGEIRLEMREAKGEGSKRRGMVRSQDMSWKMNHVLAKSDDFNTKYRPRPTANNTAILSSHSLSLLSVFYQHKKNMLSGAQNDTWLTVTYMKQTPKHARKWIFDLVDLHVNRTDVNKSLLYNAPTGRWKKFILNSHKFHKPHNSVRGCVPHWNSA